MYKNVIKKIEKYCQFDIKYFLMRVCGTFFIVHACHVENSFLMAFFMLFGIILLSDSSRKW